MIEAAFERANELAAEAIAARPREDYARLHRQLAELVAAEQIAGKIACDVDPFAAAVRLVALSEGLAYYVLIGVTEARATRDAVLASIAALALDGRCAMLNDAASPAREAAAAHRPPAE